MGLIQYYLITCQPVNQAICIFIIVPILFCNLVSIKCIFVLFFFSYYSLIAFHIIVDKRVSWFILVEINCVYVYTVDLCAINI